MMRALFITGLCWLCVYLPAHAQEDRPQLRLPQACDAEHICQPPPSCETLELDAEACTEYLENYQQKRARGALTDENKITQPPYAFGSRLPPNSEALLPDAVLTMWSTTRADLKPHANDTVQAVEQARNDGEQAPLLQELLSGVQTEVSPAQEQLVTKLREVIDGLRGKNVRLHVIGHTDDAPLNTSERARFGDHQTLSQIRAQEAADYFRRALQLPQDAISHEGRGAREPLTDNDSEQARAQNRRVEIQLWLEQPTPIQTEASVSDIRRVKVCRVQERCIFRRKAGGAERVQLKNVVVPLRYDGLEFEVPAATVQQISIALQQARAQGQASLRFIGHADNQPLNASMQTLYGDRQGLSHHVAEVFARRVQTVLDLPNRAITVIGRGDSEPLAPNDTASGRALNRRIDIEVWYGDSGTEVAGEPQLCPEDGGAETVTVVHADKPVVFFKNGQPDYPRGFVQRVASLLEQLQDKAHLRINFVGHTTNERLTRRAAMVYGDHKGLSVARAKRVLAYIQQELKLDKEQVLSEGRGFVEPYRDNDTSVFAQREFLLPGGDLGSTTNPKDARVELEFLYEEPAILQQDPNLEIVRVQQEEGPVSPYALHPIRISVDGEAVDGTRLHSADIQRCTDVALDKAQLQLRYDNLKLTPRLNVHATPSTVAYFDDATTPERHENLINFTAYSNYMAFITRAEVRIFDLEQSLQSAPLAVVQLDADLQGEWWWVPWVKEFEGPLRELQYVLRVYNQNGLFDETRPKRLWVVHQRKLTEESLNPDQHSEQLAGYGESQLGLRNIPLQGGTVTVSGEAIPEGHRVWIMDQAVPLDTQGRFAGEYIIPDGLHSVEVSVFDRQGRGELFMRDFRFKENDWYYVGMADLTVGRDDTEGPARLVTQDETHFNNETFVDGHLAFYTKGKTKRDYIITASADTLEEPFENLFSNFMDKNPDAVFRRLDPDYFYPTYGDDSTVIDDAPTKGKFYVKAEKNKSYAMWGNFETKLTETDLAQIDRSLYGANWHLESLQTTEYGESKHNIDLFAAEPGTIQQRDEFRGTGGSLYFLRRRDITVGSDRARIEVRDKDSGLVLQVRNLVPNQDYDIDYIQGRVLLAEPLPSTADDGLLVQGGSLNGHPVYLVVRYEHTPGFEQLEDVASGGRLSKWFGDHVQLGTTFSSQEQVGDTHELAGVDITLRATPLSYVRLESASSQGPGQNEIFSNDGGFQFNSITQPPPSDEAAGAYRLEAAGNLSDLYRKLNGNATFYMEEREAGYSAPGQFTLQELSLMGGSLRMPVHTKADMYLKFDQRERVQGLSTRAAELDAYYRHSERWRYSAGLRMDEREDNSVAVPLTQTQGERTDLAVEARYDSQKDWSAYTFVQSTLQVTETRDNNDRAGVGGAYQISDRWKLDAEVSAGDGGSGARIGTDYLYSDRTSVYLSYLLEPERSDTGLRGRNGRSAVGFRSRYSDSVSVYGEERYTFGDIPNGLTHAYGVDLAPTDKWLFGVSAEMGTLEDNETSAKIDRTAYGLRTSYGSERLQWASAVEYREDITDTSERQTTFFKNNFNYQLTPNWRVVGKYNASDSESSQGEFYDGNFTEFVLGYAYRPVLNDKLNAIVKYTYFENMPSTDQFSGSNTARIDFIQRSNIYAFDLTYDWNARLTLGGKYAVRIGEVAVERVNPQFFDSKAVLTILRGDWHVVKKWDVITELRNLEVIEAQDSRSGVLLGVYRQFGNHLKAGVGYNFTDFSDDLTDLDYDSQGLFINITGKL